MLPEYPELLAEIATSFSHEGELLKAIRKLHETFLHTPKNIRELYRERRYAEAYAAFYMPTNTPKLKRLLQWNQLELPPDLALVDVGAGPGTLTWALSEYDPRPRTIYFLEQHPTMLEIALRLGRKYFPQHDYAPITHAHEIPSRAILLLGHVVVESPSLIEGLINAEPELLIALEPGTRLSFQGMLSLRDKMLAARYQLLYPCTHQQACPMGRDGDNWCHQLMHFTHHPQLERFSQILKLDRRHNPLIAHIYRHPDSLLKPPPAPSARIIRELQRTKYSHRLEVCLPGGELQEREILHKKLPRELKKELKKMDWGEDLARYRDYLKTL